jgi:hypothetical protein
MESVFMVYLKPTGPKYQTVLLICSSELAEGQLRRFGEWVEKLRCHKEAPLTAFLFESDAAPIQKELQELSHKKQKIARGKDLTSDCIEPDSKWADISKAEGCPWWVTLSDREKTLSMFA